jgi:hypothetical protein
MEAQRMRYEQLHMRPGAVLVIINLGAVEQRVPEGHCSVVAEFARVWSRGKDHHKFRQQRNALRAKDLLKPAIADNSPSLTIPPAEQH